VLEQKEDNKNICQVKTGKQTKPKLKPRNMKLILTVFEVVVLSQESRAQEKHEKQL
jgi:hypothetical protein